MAYSPKKLRPGHLIIIRLHWQGESNTDIAMLTGVTPQTVSNIINSEEAQSILAGLQSDVMDTMAQVQTDAQFMAPKLFDNIIKMAESATDERVRLHANLAGIGIAGHVPIKRMIVERESALQKKFEDMSEDEIRNSIAGDIGSSAKGPDGNILQ
jgi:hypothetical protein